MKMYLSSLMIIIIILSVSNYGQPGGGRDDETETDTDTMTETASLCDIDGSDASYSERISGDIRIIESNGCPNHYSECIGKPGLCDIGDEVTEAAVFNFNITIPAYPCFNDYVDDSSYSWVGYPVYCLLNSLGIALNGVSLFSPSANTECKDAIGEESNSFDYCGGHAGPGGLYHYHVAPSCLLDQVNDSDTINADGHSPIIGWAFDGFPVYGPHGLNGEYIKLCTQNGTNSSDCLDNCSGHDQHEIDGFKYHYHIASPVGDLHSQPINPTPDTSRWPYTFGCFRGIPADWSLIAINTQNIPTLNCTASGTTDDYVPKAFDGITDVYVSPYYDYDTTNDPTEISTEIETTEIDATSQSAYFIFPPILLMYMLYFIFIS